MGFLLHGARVLVVGNNDEVFLLAQHLLEDPTNNIGVEHAQSYDQAASCINSGTYDVIFLDYDLGENRATQLIDAIRAHGPDVPIIVLVRNGDEQDAAKVIKSGAAGLLVKSKITLELAGAAIRQAVRNNREFQQKEQELPSTREQRFRALVERGSTGLSAISREGNIIYANNVAEHILGYPLQEFIGRNIFDFIDPAENLAMQQEFQKCVSTPGTNLTVTCRCRHKNGFWLRLEIIATNYLSDPAVNAIVVDFRDVTYQYRAAEALRESEEKFSKVFNANPLPTAVSRVKDGCCIDANAAFAEIIGLSREEIVGRCILDIGFWLIPERREDLIERLQAGERVRDEEIEFSTSQGTLCGQISMELIEIGSELCYISIIRDVTKHKQTEQALLESNEKLRAIIEASPAAITALDAAGTVQIWNPAAEQMYGWTAAEVVGKKLPTVPGEDHLQFLAFRKRLLQGESIEPFEATRRHKDGSVLHSLVSLAPLRHNDGGVFGTFSIQLNITGRKVAEEALRQSTLELQAAKEAAEAATRAKSEFVANMSHEIRTPMNGILGMTELALSTELSAEQREFLGLVKSSADSLMVIINDILDYSKMEAGKLALDPIGFNLRDTLGDIMKVMAISAHQKGLELTCHVHPSVPLELVGDSSRLRQVILNLVGNAIKFTSQGEVAVAVSAAERNPHNLMLRFTIRDTGVGISRDKQDTIFHAFEQADSSTTRRYGGTGLGLAISTRILQLMGGKIWVESTPGEGSTFHFTAQFALLDRPGAAPISADLEDLRGLRALIVDDNRTCRLVLDEMLHLWGMETVTADSGAAALALLEDASQTGQPFHLILLDEQMPVMDGCGTIERIRALPSWAGAIIMLRSSIDSPARSTCDNSHTVHSYLNKPVQELELQKAILKALGKHQEDPAPPPMADSDQQPHDPMRVLLAEDNLVNQKLAATMLEKMGHTVVRAATGKDALERWTQDHFDLVFMDVQMPEMDGFEATQEIRLREKEKWTGAHVPIVAMTANTMSGDRERCLKAGMDDYVGKPITRSELLRIVAKYGPRKVGKPCLPDTTSANPDPGTDLSAPARR